MFKFLCSAKCIKSVYTDLRLIRYIDFKVCHPILRGPNCRNFTKSQPSKLSQVSNQCKLIKISCFYCVARFKTCFFCTQINRPLDYWPVLHRFIAMAYILLHNCSCFLLKYFQKYSEQGNTFKMLQIGSSSSLLTNIFNNVKHNNIAQKLIPKFLLKDIPKTDDGTMSYSTNELLNKLFQFL